MNSMGALEHNVTIVNLFLDVAIIFIPIGAYRTAFLTVGKHLSH